MRNPGSSAVIWNHCGGSKWVPKPNLKQGLKRTAGGESVGWLSWSLSWWLWAPPPPTPAFPKTHMNQTPSNTYTHLQRAHPVLPRALCCFEVEFRNLLDTHGSVQRCQLCSVVGSVCGTRKKTWRERGGGLKGEREKRRSSFIQEILDAPPPLPPAESDTSWNTQTMAQWKKSPLILLLITHNPLCPWDLYTFFPFCANALSWEWLVSVDKSPYFILPPRGCCLSASRLTIMPRYLTINPSYFWWCTPTALYPSLINHWLFVRTLHLIT